MNRVAPLLARRREVLSRIAENVAAAKGLRMIPQEPIDLVK